MSDEIDRLRLEVVEKARAKLREKGMTDADIDAAVKKERRRKHA